MIGRSLVSPTSVTCVALIVLKYHSLAQHLDESYQRPPPPISREEVRAHPPSDSTPIPGHSPARLLIASSCLFHVFYVFLSVLPSLPCPKRTFLSVLCGQVASSTKPPTLRANTTDAISLPHTLSCIVAVICTALVPPDCKLFAGQ